MGEDELAEINYQEKCQEISEYNYKLLNKIKQLEDELSDIKESYKIVMDEKCADDEKHCTCVPILRDKIHEITLWAYTHKDKDIIKILEE